ncbi:EAL domain-containing protein [uncultured Cohaesibacter sp.]|uniref:EAL domain-containing protein n=1 Tax=uncultured Cohaesibacter sp. TaxID=1002546 RepID=UPI002AA8BE00|nr:EAL domain-containing protein [uncultured Cohaesibacter sp.]
MIRNAKKIAGYSFLATVSAGLLTIGMQFAMRWQVEKEIKEDLQISADVMLERASDAAQTAINVLNDLAQSPGLSCTTDHRYRYSEATRSSAWIDTIGLVDRSGNLVCTDLGQSARQTGLLPAYQLGDKTVTLSLSAGAGQFDMPSLLVVRHVANGRRLVARVPGELVRIDPVRNDLRRFRYAMLSMEGGTHWFILEPDVSGGDIIDRVSVRSDVLPFEVQMSITEAALDAVTADAREFINLLGLFFGFIMVGIGWYFGRYRPTEGDMILDALDNGEILPYMQPIIDLDSGAITGCEVLARWLKPNGSIVSPQEFIPLAQNYRLTREVTFRIMQESCRLLDPVVREGQVFKVALNLFSHQMLDDSIVADIEEVFRDSKLGFKNLIFEISDRVPIEEMDLAKDVISQIRALGAEIALDDVGSGHSGLYNLSSISVDILKLDKLLVDALDGGFAGPELVQGLISLAETLNIGVIAEGVEKEEQVIQLRKMGVSAAQGYLFAPPLPASSFCELMRVARKRNMGVEEGADTEDAPEDGVEEAA